MPDHHPPRSLLSASLLKHCDLHDQRPQISLSISHSHRLSDCYRLWTRIVFSPTEKSIDLLRVVLSLRPEWSYVCVRFELFRRRRWLLPAKKAWKMFTSKLNRRLKLNRSNFKTIKKPKKRIITTRKSVPWLTLAFKPHTLQCRRTIKTTRNLYCHHLPKKSAPVYIDEFFKEPQMSLLKNHLQPPATAAKTRESEEGREERGTKADDVGIIGFGFTTDAGNKRASRGVYH